MRAVSTSEEHPYVCEKDRDLDKKDQTTFYLRVLSIKQRVSLENSVTHLDGKTNKMAVNAGSTALDTLRFGLVGWDNLLDAERNEVLFKTEVSRVHRIEVPTDVTLSKLPAAVRRELANAIDQETFLTAEDVGKSDSQLNEPLEN